MNTIIKSSAGKSAPILMIPELAGKVLRYLEVREQTAQVREVCRVAESMARTTRRNIVTTVRENSRRIDQMLQCLPLMSEELRKDIIGAIRAIIENEPAAIEATCRGGFRPQLPAVN